MRLCISPDPFDPGFNKPSGALQNLAPRPGEQAPRGVGSARGDRCRVLASACAGLKHWDSRILWELGNASPWGEEAGHIPPMPGYSFTDSVNQHVSVEYLLKEAAAQRAGGHRSRDQLNGSIALGQARVWGVTLLTPGKMSNALVSWTVNSWNL